MATDVSNKIATLKAELKAVENSISMIETNGQEFKKGQTSGFSVSFASLPSLYARKDIINAKLTAWENSI